MERQYVDTPEGMLELLEKFEGEECYKVQHSMLYGFIVGDTEYVIRYIHLAGSGRSRGEKFMIVFQKLPERESDD